MPSIVVDKYGDTLSLQIDAGLERFTPLLVDALLSTVACKAIRQRGLAAASSNRSSSAKKSDAGESVERWLHGDAPRDVVRIVDDAGLLMDVDVVRGHKTGAYLDQSENRALFRELVSRHKLKRVLDICCYTGGFALAALQGGAEHVTCIDASDDALEQVAFVSLYTSASSGFLLTTLSRCTDQAARRAQRL